MGANGLESALKPARIWLLAGPRPGELAQQRLLARAMKLPVEEKRLCFSAEDAKRAAFGWKPAMAASCGLVGPWPELLISFGKTLPAALWVRSASGGKSRIVHLGRPRHVHADDLDLILPMPQDSVADAPNVLRLRMPLNASPVPSVEALHRARQRLASLPRPFTLLVIGGGTRHFRLDEKTVVTAVEKLGQQQKSAGGSLLVSTSPRTPIAWLAALQAALAASGMPHELSPYRASGDDDVYAEYLALADDCVLTADSASMIADCWRSRLPIRVVTLLPSYWLRANRRLLPLLPHSLVSALVRRGLLSATVDLDVWIESLVAQGLIGIFGASSAPPSWSAEADDDLQRAVQRASALLGR